ncbi:MAG: hypothetical protein WDN48_08300 [Pseudolabrys sp.]
MLVIDQRAYGGQAGASSRIENYLGFPTGISGQALAGRAFTQAQKFGAEIAIPLEVTSSIAAADRRAPIFSGWKSPATKRFRPGPSSSPRARVTAGRISPICRSSTAPAFPIGRLRSKRGCARAKRSR